jgi:3-dehydroquinate dehydratase-2
MAARKLPAKPQLRILVLSGPNLDRLGTREPEIYGRMTLGAIHAGLEHAGGPGVSVDCRQTNHEGLLVDWIGAAQGEGFQGILLNAAAYTHTSYALADAIRLAGIPTVEVHISNPDAREEFRHVSTIAAVCKARVAGFGAASYAVALAGLIGIIENEAKGGKRGASGNQAGSRRRLH